MVRALLRIWAFPQESGSERAAEQAGEHAATGQVATWEARTHALHSWADQKLDQKFGGAALGSLANDDDELPCLDITDREDADAQIQVFLVCNKHSKHPIECSSLKRFVSVCVFRFLMAGFPWVSSSRFVFLFARCRFF